jgi:hypothetical protein
MFLFSLLFQFGCAQPNLTSSDPPAVIPQPATVGTVFNNKSVDVDLTAWQVVNSATITIANRGTDSAVMPAVFVKGDAALNRESILSFIKSSGPLSDEQFALATWRFLKDHTQHYCVAGAPGDPGNFALDPLRLLNGYGEICCDQSAVVLSWLWASAGYPSRFGEMPFHTVAEIYYSGAWHLYDADEKVFYLKKDNKTVASLADIIADPSLVSRVADANGNDPSGINAQWLADQFAVAKPSYNNIQDPKESVWYLLPNQTFTLRSQNSTNEVFNGRPDDDALSPGTVTSGQFDLKLDFAQPDWDKLTNNQYGVTTLISGSDGFLTNTSSSLGPGYVVYHLSSPFPVFSLAVSGIVYREDSSARINASLLLDGMHWAPAFPMNAEVGTPTQATVDLTSAAAGQYSYWVMLELSGSAPYVARIGSVHITAEVQVAQILFPTLVPSAVNHLIFQDWSPALDTHDVNISVDVK